MLYRHSGNSEGLSPPTRGIRFRFTLPLTFGGSIPAYAGDPFV